MKLRNQLLLVSLMTLALPWAGCQYVREMEGALREGQTRVLLAQAKATAGVLADQPARLYPGYESYKDIPSPSGELFAADIYAPIRIDGFADDWPGNPATGARAEPLPAPWSSGSADDWGRLGFLLARDAHFVYLFLQVTNSGDEAPDFGQAGIVLAVENPDAHRYNYHFATRAPGPVIPLATLVPGKPGQEPHPEIRINANWQETSTGFNLELRIPRHMVGERLGFMALPGGAGSKPIAGTMGSLTDQRPGRMVQPLPELGRLLESLAQPGVRLRITDRSGWELARAGTPRPAQASVIDAPGPLLRLYRAMLGDPTAPPPPARQPGKLSGTVIAAALGGRNWVSRYGSRASNRVMVAAGVPIRSDGRVIGAVLAEQNSDAILTLTDRALARLLNLSLLATVLAVLALLAYATVLSLRVRRLRNAAAHALGPRGTVRADVPGTGAGDELGDLSRAVDTMLGQLDEYTRYLQTLGDKLAHELRTPLTVVQSSMENLDSVDLPEPGRAYVDRAREGAARLAALLNSLREANRLEQSLQHAEIQKFDLAQLVTGMAAGYRDAFADRRIHTRLPEGPAPWEGAPDLTAQILDKLVENALGFSNEGGAISIGLETTGAGYRLKVANDGPRLEEDATEQLFDSLVSRRTERGDTPHLGLGLYLVRLIAEFHGGSVSAGNSAELTGAEFIVELPRRPLQAN